jgi:hypothetical protein
MQQTLWEEKIPNRRRKKKIIPLIPATPYSVTGNDCEALGHTLRAWDLAGCTICIDCGVKIFCRRCIAKHPQDETAIPILCELHQESMVSA